jgi:NAD(P)-dependent dehydrogenase (short-subunit alcohol dehydrogenase family)
MSDPFPAFPGSGSVVVMTDTAKIALITGGNRGLGRATALALAGAGTDVVLTYRSNADEAAAVVEEISALERRAVTLQLDTTEAAFGGFVDALRHALKETWDRDTFDHLVNNAGVGATTTLGETAPETLDTLFAVHVKGVYLLTQALLPLLADNGRIINTSSGLARFAGPGYSAYGAMKGAVEVLTRYWAQELGPRGITVNVVAPGPVATDFGGGYLRDNQQVREAMGARAALGRIGEPDDIGALIAALLVDGTRWMTGQRIEASGGTLL